MRVDLTNQVALVTGAGRGIGQAIADALVANGARVCYSDIDFESARAAACTKPAGHLAMSMHLDVSNPEDVEYSVDILLAKWGRLDILVNNAGVNTLAHRVNVDQFPLDEWERILKVDLTGLFLMSRAAAKPMIAQGYGRIINIASIAGLVPLRLQSPFVQAKGGVGDLET